MIKKSKQKTRGSALLSSVLVLTTCLIFLQFYQQIYRDSMQNDFLLIEYLLNN